MVKSRIFDNTQLLKEHPELPHYKEEVVCFRSEYKDRSYPANECYFNRELYMIFVLEGRSEILLNGEFIAIEPNMLLIHGANYLTEHLYSSRDIKFITLALPMNSVLRVLQNPTRHPLVYVCSPDLSSQTARIPICRVRSISDNNPPVFQQLLKHPYLQFAHTP